RAPILTTCCGHRAGQGPGEVRQLGRVCTVCGCFPGRPFCQAPSWNPEVCSASACRTMALREEHHLLPSAVLPRPSGGGNGLRPCFQQKGEHST
ncbi:hypothetical protein HPG69_000299, partial [Diceros bicornis minor]